MGMCYLRGSELSGRTGFMMQTSKLERVSGRREPIQCLRWTRSGTPLMVEWSTNSVALLQYSKSEDCDKQLG